VSSEQIEISYGEIRCAATREREEISLQEMSVKREFAAISLSTEVREEATIGLGKARFFLPSAYCLLLTALLTVWRRRVGIEPT
jgi:hypothetical protein